MSSRTKLRPTVNESMKLTHLKATLSTARKKVSLGQSGQKASQLACVPLTHLGSMWSMEEETRGAGIIIT